MISGRIQGLVGSLCVLQKYGVYFLSQSSKTFNFCISCDSFGLFLYAPLISYYTSLSAQQGVLLLFALMSFSLWMSFFVFFILTLSSRFLIVALSIWTAYFSYKIYTINDIYIAQAWAFLPVGFLLMALIYHKKSIWYGASFLTGIVGFVSSFIRAQAMMPVYVFYAGVLFFLPFLSKKEKTFSLILLLCGAMIPYVHYTYHTHKTEKFLRKYNKVIEYPSHYLLHNMYIGFGFLHNNYNITWADCCTDNVVTTLLKNDSYYLNCVNPQEKSAYKIRVYDALVAQLLLQLFKKDPHFFMTSLFAKCGVIFMFFLLCFGWLGLLLSYYFPKPWYQECVWLVTLLLAALPGIIALPCFEYLAGFVTATVLYTLHSIVIAGRYRLHNVFIYKLKG